LAKEFASIGENVNRVGRASSQTWRGQESEVSRIRGILRYKQLELSKSHQHKLEGGLANVDFSEWLEKNLAKDAAQSLRLQPIIDRDLTHKPDLWTG
jgi:hypothetical protein